jgi:hypothetical protein
MLRNPRDDAWSSDNAHARRAMDPHLGGHALFDRLGASPADRRGAYRSCFAGRPMRISPTRCVPRRTADGRLATRASNGRSPRL